ncbi:MAG: hypothetical protein ACRD1X_17920 [Vicinamibacteria bacterium]
MSAVNDTLIATATAFFAMFGGAWAMSQSDAKIEAKTWIAIFGGLAGGVLLWRWNRPAAMGLAAGLGGLGLTAMIAQAAGAADAGKLFGFQQAREQRQKRLQTPAVPPPTPSPSPRQVLITPGMYYAATAPRNSQA